MKPYYEDDLSTLYLGDSLEIVPELPDGSLRGVVTDPPFSSGGRRENSRSLRKSLIRSAEDVEWIPGDAMSTTGFVWTMRELAKMCRPKVVEGGHFLFFIDWRMHSNLSGALESADLRQHPTLCREHRHDARGHRTSDRYILAITTQSLPVTVTSGQSDLGSESPSLPVRESTPTGHSDRVTISRTTRDPSGGREAPTPRLSLTCNRHPDGTDKPCTACRKAREAFEAAEAAPVRLIPQRRYDPDVHCEHLQLIGKCDACADEERRAMASLTAQFGSKP